MKVLTVCQPYASLIMSPGPGRKNFENRTWRTDYRGPLIVHAGVSRKWFEHGRTEDEERAGWLRHGVALPPLAYGAALGVVDLVDCLPEAEARRGDPSNRWIFGPWCWQVERPRPFPAPIPCKGLLHLWSPGPELAAAAAPLV